ncbi:UreD-domain-containing protein [Mytilinidion resinicola]|uniref:UreD-domain-containing protein n=1 Tax=Mytilinidion resinicola TaxID=574789 RepID=A0A6A6YKY2_9PEZI|nr:UreD-domain-containing protein [Mytilinidion resinicola]KAF2809209.1 UreD-domain-containing protein [Mytilinidion resinicola]
MSFTNPFLPSSSRPGYGTVHLALLPPNTPVLQTVTYQYPLKLIAPEPLYLPSTTPNKPDDSRILIHTLFLLTYGGGLVAGDTISLTLTLAPTTRLVLLTQGSTKIFKTPSPALLSRQHTTTRLSAGAALCYLPDPVQPFADSAVAVSAIYELDDATASLCVLDWVSEGRPARGERWAFHAYRSRNEVWALDPKTNARQLLLRDNQILDRHATPTLPRLAGQGSEGELAARMDGLGAFGTLILRGPLFEGLGGAFMGEFEALPRIGGRQWEDEAPGGPAARVSELEARRGARRRQEGADGVLWSAARVRGFVLVKFGAREVEGARRWVKGMIGSEGSVAREFGEGALLCLK